MSGLSEQELRDIEARCALATPGPWRAVLEGRDGPGFDSFILRGSESERQSDLYLATDPGERVSAEDHDFIAAARHDVPLLVAEVRRLRGEPERG